MSLVLQGSTSGSITLQEPAIAGSNTINLPAATGTMALLQTPSFATTIGVGGATPSTSGAGITFPATQNASSDANTLDDYEEGTWTPSLGGTTTYNSRNGRYTKIGNIVSVIFNLNINSIGTGSSAYISGLPFIPSIMSPGTVPLYLTFGTSLTTAGCYAEPDGIIYLTGNTAAVSSTSINGGGTVLTNSSVIYGAITYRV